LKVNADTFYKHYIAVTTEITNVQDEETQGMHTEF